MRGNNHPAGKMARVMMRKSNDGWIAQIDRVSNGSRNGELIYAYDLVVRIERDVQFEAGDFVTLTKVEPEAEPNAKRVRCPIGELGNSKLIATDTIQKGDEVFVASKVDDDAELKAERLTEAGRQTEAAEADAHSKISARADAYQLDTIAALLDGGFPIPDTWSKEAIVKLKAIANRIRDIP